MPLIHHHARTSFTYISKGSTTLQCLLFGWTNTTFNTFFWVEVTTNMEIQITYEVDDSNQIMVELASN